jgi:hypothetical protein
MTEICEITLGSKRNGHRSPLSRWHGMHMGPHFNDSQTTVGFQSQMHVTICGTPDSNINSTIMKCDHAACAMIKQKIGKMSLHASQYMRRYRDLIHGGNCERPSNVGRYRMTFGWLREKGSSLPLLPQRKQKIEPS